MGPLGVDSETPPPPTTTTTEAAASCHNDHVGTSTSQATATTAPQQETHQPLSLQDTAIRCLSRHLDVFAFMRYRNMVVPVDIFLQVLRSAHVQSGEVMLAVVRNLPCVDCPEVDEAFFKPVVEHTASACPIAEPYPVLVARLRRAKTALEEWVAARRREGQKMQAQPASPHGLFSPAGKQKIKKLDKDEKAKKEQAQVQAALPSSSSPYPPKAAAFRSSSSSSHEEVEAALRLLKELDRAPVSTQLLSATRVGEAVAAVSKLEEEVAPASVIKAAKALRRKWKALVVQQQKREQGGKAEMEEEGAMCPLAIGRAAVEATTWRQVYEFSLAYEKHRRLVVGKRALALAREQQAQRHRTKEVAITTTEEEDEEQEREGCGNGKRPPPGNTERIRKLLKMRPAVKKQEERAFGGLVMRPPGKKKKLLKVLG